MERETGYYLAMEDGALQVLWYSAHLKKFYFAGDPSSCREYDLEWVAPEPLNLASIKESYND